MPFHRALSLRPVKTLKHEITWTFLVQNASATQTVDLIHGQENPIVAQDVDIGSIVKWIYIEFNLNGVDNSGASSVFHWKVEKKPALMSTTAPNSYMQDDKKFILKRGMEMLPAIPIGSGGTVQTKRVFVVKIPPRLRRFDDDDKLILQYINSSASNINFCGFTVFKEFK